MNVYLRTKIEERASQSALLQSMQKRAADDKRDLTEAESKTFDEIVARLRDLDEQIRKISEFDQGAAKFAALVGATKEAEEESDRAHEEAKGGGAEKEPEEVRAARGYDFGKTFVESTAFKGYRGAGTSERLSLPGPASPEFRAALDTTLIGLTNYTGPIPQMWGGTAGPQWPLPFLNMVGRVATNQSAVMYLRWTPNPPADAADVAEGALKPEAPMDVTEATIALKTVAHWKAVTRQALEDIPQIQTIIQNRLLAGVRSKLEADAVAALVGAGLTPVTDADSLTNAIRVAIATVEAAGFTANAVLVNPADAAALDLSAAGMTFGGPVRTGTVWNLPIVSSNSIAAGTAYVGDFAQGITWFDRGNTDVFMSDSHADFFLRNQLVILAEARAAFAVTEATALAAATGPVVGP